MKKAYIKPDMSAMAIDFSQMIAGGPSQVDVKDSAQTGSLDAGTSWSNERAWGYSLWETPEEEEK